MAAKSTTLTAWYYFNVVTSNTDSRTLFTSGSFLFHSTSIRRGYDGYTDFLMYTETTEDGNKHAAHHETDSILSEIAEHENYGIYHLGAMQPSVILCSFLQATQIYAPFHGKPRDVCISYS